MDIHFNISNDLLEIPFTSSSQILTTLASMSSLKTVRLWIEVPLEESIFQVDYYSVDTNLQPPPLKEAALVQAVANLYSLLTTANENLRLEWLEVAFTRLDFWDRQCAYPRYLPVTLTPSLEVPVTSAGESGFTIKIGDWHEDYSERDICQFITTHIGDIY